MVIAEQFVRLVTDEIASRGWTRSDLARAMGVTPQYVSNYLNGYKSPGSDVMERFFRALDVDPQLSVTRRTPEPV